MPFNCPACEKACADVTEYTNHAREAHPENDGNEENIDVNEDIVVDSTALTDSLDSAADSTDDIQEVMPELSLKCPLCTMRFNELANFGQHTVQCKGGASAMNGQASSAEKRSMANDNEAAAKRTRTNGSDSNESGSRYEQGAANQLPNLNDEISSGTDDLPSQQRRAINLRPNTTVAAMTTATTEAEPSFGITPSIARQIGANIQSSAASHVPIQVAQIQPTNIGSQYQPRFQKQYIPGHYVLQQMPVGGQPLMMQGPMVAPSMGSAGLPTRTIKRENLNDPNGSVDSNTPTASGGANAGTNNADMIGVLQRLERSFNALRNRQELFEASMMMKLSNIEKFMEDHQRRDHE